MLHGSVNPDGRAAHDRAGRSRVSPHVCMYLCMCVPGIAQEQKKKNQHQQRVCMYDMQDADIYINTQSYSLLAQTNSPRKKEKEKLTLLLLHSST